MNCPVCGSTDSELFLELPDYPIFQHPVDNPNDIPPPYTTNITYQFCNQCSHVYQRDYDRHTLERLYTSHYYTPRPESVGQTFRENFFTFFSQTDFFQTHKNKAARVLEIGSSSGEVLLGIQNLNAKFQIKGVEPDTQNAKVAREKGVQTECCFFDSSYAEDQPVDLIYSRHVIEHIFDFQEFLHSVNDVTHAQSHLIIETPCLDWAIEHSSMAPFHAEHIHVFSKYSLAFLMNSLGWKMAKAHVSENGHMMTEFVRGEPNGAIEVERAKNSDSVGRYIRQISEHLKNLVGGKKVIYWGAGAGGRKLLSFVGFKPEFIVDSNPNKTGKYFCGIDQPITYAPDIINDIISKGQDNEYVVVVSSSFVAEIHKQLTEMGWQGQVISPYEAN